MDRSVLYGHVLDNLELYFDYKRELTKKIKNLHANERSEDTPLTYAEEHFWQEYEMLDTLRELSRRALDEYVLTGLSATPKHNPNVPSR